MRQKYVLQLFPINSLRVSNLKFFLNTSLVCPDDIWDRVKSQTILKILLIWSTTHMPIKEPAPWLIKCNFSHKKDKVNWIIKFYSSLNLCI